MALSQRRLGAQSESAPQPQRPVARQAAPAPVAEHAPVSPVAHCAHALAMQRVRPSARPAHCASARHSTQRLTPPSVDARHTGRVGDDATQSASRLQVVVHTPGRAPSSLVHDCPSGHPLRPGAQPAAQRCVVMSQRRPERASPQSLSDAQPQNAAPSAPITQACPSPAAEHARAPSAAVVQTTQVFIGPHTGADIGHAVTLVSLHCAQPPVAAHAVAPERPAHCASVVQRPHVFAVVSHTGVVIGQSELERHATHVFDGPHTGVAPEHLAALIGVHCTQAPDGAHAGVAPEQSESALQARHARVVISQIGVAPEQSALPLQPTHTLVVTSQTAVAPRHAEAFEAVHCTQAPVVALHAGVVSRAAHCISSVQRPQVCAEVSHTGVAGAQSALERHATHRLATASHTGVAPEQARALVAEH